MQELWMLPQKEAEEALEESRRRLVRYGLVLTREDAAALMEGCSAALRHTGRVEFGGGILPRLLEVFCDSPALRQENLTEELLTLQEVFYHWKNEDGDLTPDGEVLAFLRRAYDKRGAAEYLAGFSMKEMREVLADE